MTARAIFDEMSGHDGHSSDAYRVLQDWLTSAPPQLLEHRREEAELFFRRVGITFAVYGDAEAEERLIPFDIIPRILVRQRMGAPVARARAARAGRSTCS